MTQRDWQKDMEIAEQLKLWKVDPGGEEDGAAFYTIDADGIHTTVHADNMLGTDAEFLHEGIQALPYWLQEAKFYQEELSDCYKAVEQQQEEIRELTLAKYREIERADAAEAREQQLKEALELMVYMFRYDLEEGRAYMNFGDFEEVLEPDDNAAYNTATDILSTLYPDTPAPKEGE